MCTIKMFAPYYAQKIVTDLDEISFENVIELIRDNWGYEILSDIIAQYKIEPTGYFEDIHVVGADLYDFVEQEIEKAERVVAICEAEDGSLPDVEPIEFSIKQLLLEMLEERNMDENFFVDTGKIIEDSLYSFVKSSFWHFGLILPNNRGVIEDVAQWPSPVEVGERISFWKNGQELLPIIWFGPEGQAPLRRWTISPNDDEKTMRFWYDINDVMENLQGDPDQNFLLWYLYECGHYSPAIDDILASCPVMFCETDMKKQIEEKIYRFFLSKTKR